MKKRGATKSRKHNASHKKKDNMRKSKKPTKVSLKRKPKPSSKKSITKSRKETKKLINKSRKKVKKSFNKNKGKKSKASEKETKKRSGKRLSNRKSKKSSKPSKNFNSQYKKPKHAKKKRSKVIKIDLSHLGAYETELDKLLEEVNEREKISVRQVAKAFEVPKSLVEYWARILEQKGLITLHYPLIGSPKLRKKR